MEFGLFMELENLGFRLDGLTNMASLLSDVAQNGPNEVETYTDSITLLANLLQEYHEKYDDIMKRIPRGTGKVHG